LPEKGIRIPEGGLKKLRYSDLWVYKIIDGVRKDVFVQVVRHLKDGLTLPKREREAKSDIKLRYPDSDYRTIEAGE
jgi:hypothetical protein